MLTDPSRVLTPFFPSSPPPLSAEDCWLAARNKVYDATPYFAMGPQAHPGGMNIIKRKAGTDVSRDYKFHSTKAKKQLWSSFEIGYLTR